MGNLLQFLGRLTPQRNLQDLQHRLEVAGRPFGWTVLSFLGLRLLSALLLAALILLLTLFAGDLTMGRRLMLSAAFGALGYFLPIVWLNSYTGVASQRCRAPCRMGWTCSTSALGRGLVSMQP